MKNTDEEIITILNLLKCENIINIGDMERYRYCDLNDKEVQYAMLDYDAVTLYYYTFFDMKKIRKKMSYTMYGISKKKKGVKFIFEKYANVVQEITNFIKKYTNFKADQYNIKTYYDDASRVEKYINDFLEQRNIRISSIHEEI